MNLMKTVCLLLLACLAMPAFGAEKTKKTSPRKKQSARTVPSKYPSIIQLPAAPEAVIEDGQRPPLISTELGGRELQFFHAANEAGAQQLALTNLAKSKASSEEIKSVSETMAKAQVEENARVAELASRKGVNLAPMFPARLAEEFAPLWGAKFDKNWIERLVTVNTNAVAAYEGGAQAEDGEIKGFAEKMLPVVKAKLQLANRLAGVSTPKAAAAPTADTEPADDTGKQAPATGPGSTPAPKAAVSAAKVPPAEPSAPGSTPKAAVPPASQPAPALR
jgi:predicted outer membrane protein